MAKVSKITGLNRRNQRGFTLLEVMVALMILAMSLAAISFSNAAAMNQVSRITRMTTAAFLMEGVVNDIHAHYVSQGLPSNSIEDRQCDLPRDFQNIYECRYDLKALNLTPDQVTTLAEAAMTQFANLGELGQDMDGVSSGGLDLQQLAVFSPLFGPMGQELMALCRVDMSQVIMGVTAMTGFLPRIIDEVSKRTRQLTVRLTWRDGPRGSRELPVQTFRVSLPEEEMAAKREMERMMDVQEAVQANTPGFGTRGTITPQGTPSTQMPVGGGAKLPFGGGK